MWACLRHGDLLFSVRVPELQLGADKHWDEMAVTCRLGRLQHFMACAVETV